MINNCEFGDSRCWFLHKNGTVKQFDCTLCGETFAVQAKLLEHRRVYHLNSVKTCRSLLSGTCKYGKLKCWFNHNESGDVIETQDTEKANAEVIERLFKLMENLTKQIVDIKENNNLK